MINKSKIMLTLAVIGIIGTSFAAANINPTVTKIAGIIAGIAGSIGVGLARLSTMPSETAGAVIDTAKPSTDVVTGEVKPAEVKP